MTFFYDYLLYRGTNLTDFYVIMSLCVGNEDFLCLNNENTYLKFYLNIHEFIEAQILIIIVKKL